jgi:hypothetical protein
LRLRAIQAVLAAAAAFGLPAFSAPLVGTSSASARIFLWTPKTNEFASSPPGLYEPRTVQIPPMGTNFVRRIEWSGWNTPRAVGYGTNTTSFGRIRVRLVASQPRKDYKIYRACLHEHAVPLVSYYSRLLITIAAPAPKGLKPGPLVNGNFAAPPQVQC